jgi:uncharacterized protein YjiS (DUF1127 family)
MNHTTQIDTTPGRLARVVEQSIQAVLAALQQRIADWKRRQLVRQTLHALHRLDSRTLRDLGFDRSEVVSVAAEVSGDAEVTRVRLLARIARG